MDTNTTTAVWPRDTDGAWLSGPRVQRLAAAVRTQREQVADGLQAGALDVAAALLAGVLASVPPVPRPASRWEVAGPLLGLLVSLGGLVGEQAELALGEAGW